MSGDRHIRSVVLASSGNFLDMYDFMVYGFYAKFIAVNFFPAASLLTSLIAAFVAFGIGFLARPVGGIILGAYVDRRGRRAGLVLAIALMGIGTLSIAIMPTYREIGVFAPILIVLGRLLQGLAAGVQVGAVSVYLAEIAPPGKKGFYVAWQSGSQQVAVVFAALVGLLASIWLTGPQMVAFGWRIPFLIGSLLIPLVFYLRRWLDESPAYLAQEKHPQLRVIMRSFLRSWRIVLLGAMMATTTTVFFYTVTSYTPTYGSAILRLSVGDSLFVTVCVGVVNFCLLPTMGALSDRVGRKPLLVTCAVLGIITAYPALLWLTTHPTLGNLLSAELWLALVYATYNSAMVVFLAEVMPADVRTTAFSFAYSLATACFGGFTPAVSTWLIRFARDNDYGHAAAAPGLWLAFAAALGLIAVLLLRPPETFTAAERE